MKRRLKILFTITSLLSIQLISLGQSKLDDIIIDGLYTTNLTDFFDSIEKGKSIRFSFDRNEFSKIKIDARYFSRSLKTILDQICKKHNLKWKSGTDGIIYIYDPGKESFASLEKYKGPATKSNLTVSGIVKDSKTGETLPYVSIVVKGTSIGTTTNIDGRYTLLRVLNDTCTIVFSYLGYNKLEVQLNPNRDLTNLVVDLTISSTELDEVVVTANRELFQVNQKVAMVKLTPAKLDVLPSMGEKDVFRSLQLMPGISAANENSSGLYVRGGTPDQSLVTYDGFTVYHVDHLFGFYSAFNSNAIKDINLYKGGFESKFGGRISSVAEITGKDGNQNDFNIGGDISLLSANIFAETPIGKKTTILLAGRRSWKGPIYNSIFDTFGPEEAEVPTQNANRPGFSSTETTVSSYFYDLNGKITFRPTNKDVISLSFYNGADNLDNSIEVPSFGANFGSFQSSSTDITEWGNTGSSLKWSRQWTPKLYINTLVSYSNYYSNRDRTSSRTITPEDGESRTMKNGILEDNTIDDLSFKADIVYQHSNNHTFEAGTHITSNTIDYSYSQNDTVSIITRNDKGKTYAFYVQDRINLFDNKLQLIPGIRYTYFDVTGKNYFEPRLSANYYLNDKITLKAALGEYNQFAKRVIREDVLEGSKDFWVLANGDNLPVSKAHHIIAGASYEKNGFVFDVEGYYKKLQGLTEYSLRFTTDLGGITYDDSFFQGTGNTKGIDFLIQKSKGNYTGWIGYTLSETLYNFPIYQETDFHASNDVTHEFKIVNLYKWRKWDFSATWIFATGRPYTEPTGGYSITLLDGTEQDYVSVSSKNGMRLPNYHRLDAAITYSWEGENGTKNSLGLSLFNIYNRSNVWYREFQIEENELIQTNVNYLGFTPNVTLTIKLK